MAPTAMIVYEVFLLLSLMMSNSVRAGKAPNVHAQETVNVCEGDTRGDRRCAHDMTHRVCAKIGDEDTSFFHFTGQHNWCGTVGNYGGIYGDLTRCPSSNPTWCICKWATAEWIRGEGCNDSVEIDCDATDVCNTDYGLFFSYTDFSVDLKPAHDCIKVKCKEQWDACAAANPTHPKSLSSGTVDEASGTVSNSENDEDENNDGDNWLKYILGLILGISLLTILVFGAYFAFQKKVWKTNSGTPLSELSSAARRSPDNGDDTNDEQDNVDHTFGGNENVACVVEAECS